VAHNSSTSPEIGWPWMVCTDYTGTIMKAHFDPWPNLIRCPKFGNGDKQRLNVPALVVPLVQRQIRSSWGPPIWIILSFGHPVLHPVLPSASE